MRRCHSPALQPKFSRISAQTSHRASLRLVLFPLATIRSRRILYPGRRLARLRPSLRCRKFNSWRLGVFASLVCLRQRTNISRSRACFPVAESAFRSRTNRFLAAHRSGSFSATRLGSSVLQVKIRCRRAAPPRDSHGICLDRFSSASSRFGKSSSIL